MKVFEKRKWQRNRKLCYHPYKGNTGLSSRHKPVTGLFTHSWIVYSFCNKESYIIEHLLLNHYGRVQNVLGLGPGP